MYYLASSMTDPDSKKIKNRDTVLSRNERIAKKLEKLGISIYLPQRDTNQKTNSRRIFQQNIDALKKCDGVILILSDTRGIYFEAGYAKALGKPIIGMKVEETKAPGIMVRNFLDNYVTSIDELLVLLKK